MLPIKIPSPFSPHEFLTRDGYGAQQQSHFAILVEVGDRDPCGSKDARVIDVLETTQEPENHHASLSEKGAGLITQLKCTYSNAHSMGNKQEDQEAMVQEENCDTVAMTETWWDESQSLSAAMDGYKLCRRDGQGGKGSGVAPHVSKCLDCLELHGGDNEVECLCVSIRGKVNQEDILVGVCYRPPNQGEEVGEIFYKQLGLVSQLLALVGDVN
ncbi:mitochondrial fission process protein 1 [Pitangus sulphuratus]|nr:mitochondrial fission process protein 1 [Pitangus sulphuratus]